MILIFAILILVLVIIVSSMPIYIHILSANDTIKLYFTFFFKDMLIPHQRLMKFDKINKNKIKKEMHLFNRFTTKLVSYSVIDKIYVAKYTDNPNIYPIANGLFYIVANISYSILNCRFRAINDSSLRLDKKHYKGIDYYLKAHTSLFQMIWAFIMTIFSR